VVVGVPKGLSRGVVESLLVADDVGVADGGEDAHLVDGVVNLSVGEVHQFHLFEGIDGFVDQPLHLVDARVSSLPKLCQDLKVVHRHAVPIYYNPLLFIIPNHNAPPQTTLSSRLMSIPQTKTILIYALYKSMGLVAYLGSLL
jgi:hypothetical protein